MYSSVKESKISQSLSDREPSGPSAHARPRPKASALHLVKALLAEEAPNQNHPFAVGDVLKTCAPNGPGRAWPDSAAFTDSSATDPSLMHRAGAAANSNSAHVVKDMKARTDIILLFETNAADTAAPRRAAGHDPAALAIVNLLLGEERPREGYVCEAGVYLGSRSRVYTAHYTGSRGGPVWRSTGLRDYRAALKLAQEWETAARVERIKLRLGTRKAATRVRVSPAAVPIGFTQEETAAIMGLSVRAVGTIERRAIEKLRANALLRDLWRQYTTGELGEAYSALEPNEVLALFDLCATAEEIKLIEKIVRLVHP